MQHSTLTVVTGPASEPVTLATAKNHLRLDHAFDDELVALYLAAAREKAEAFLGRALMSQTLKWIVAPADDRRPGGPFGLGRAIELPRAPVQSITSVIVTEEDGTATTLAAGDYTADLALHPARICIDPAAEFTSGNTAGTAALRDIAIQFVAGYATADAVPRPVVLGVLVITAWLYERRGDDGGEIPAAAKALLDPHRIWHLGG